MPPDNEVGPRGNPEGTDNTTPTTSKHHQAGYPHSNRGWRQCRCNTRFHRHADAWREGFRRGAIDALRVAAREIDDPAAWAVLVQLCDRYDPDGYELVGGAS
jgi:hypothetical protein